MFEWILLLKYIFFKIKLALRIMQNFNYNYEVSNYDDVKIVKQIITLFMLNKD